MLSDITYRIIKVENITKIKCYRYREQSTGYQEGGGLGRDNTEFGEWEAKVLGVR